MQIPFKRNIHFALIHRLLVILLLFTVTRILFYFFNANYFGGLSTTELLRILFYGIRFDISAIIIVNIPFIFFNIIPFKIKNHYIYQKVVKILFIVTNSIALGFNCVDFIYFRFTFKRTTADLFNLIGFGNDFTNLLPQFLKDFWYVVVIWVLLIILLIYLYNRTNFYLKIKTSGVKYYLWQSILFIVFTGISIILMRGGFQLRPISIITAGQYASAQNVPVILNTPFTIIKTYDKSALDKATYLTEPALNKIYSPCHIEKKKDFNNMNVVIIILESFSKEHFGSLNPALEGGKYKGYTPFLDSLISVSLVFPNTYANGKKSIEAIPAVISSLPSLMNNPFISSPYAGNNIYSLANLLKKKGYTSSFYHGGNNGTMGFNDYAKLVGFDNYYGRNEFNNKQYYDGKWGIFDEEFLQYTANNLNKTKQPFFSAIFTLSSHHPYTIPAKYKGKFAKGKLDIHQSIRYVDYSLAKFFKKASAMPWFDNTLFVITADHTSNAVYPYYQNRVGMYAIPLIFYKHNSNLKGVNSTTAQQADIMPSVLDYLHYDNNFIAFGESVFDSASDNHFAVNYLNDSYQLIKGNYALLFDGKESFALYDIKTDSLLQHNLIDSPDKARKEMENFLKAFIQSYNNRMLNNKLTID